MRNMEPFFPTGECKTGDIFLPLKDKRKEKARDQKLEQTPEETGYHCTKANHSHSIQQESSQQVKTEWNGAVNRMNQSELQAKASLYLAGSAGKKTRASSSSFGLAFPAIAKMRGGNVKLRQ